MSDPPVTDEHSDGPDDVPAPASPTTFRERLTQTFSRPPAPRASKPGSDPEPDRPLTDKELKAKVTRIDQTERKIGYLGAGLGAVMALTFTVPYIGNPKEGAKVTNATHAETISKSCGVRYEFQAKTAAHAARCVPIIYSRTYWVVTLLILMAFPLAIFVTVRIGRRAPLAYASLMTGLAFEVTLGLFGLPFLAAGAWLLIRAWKSQRYGSPTAKRGDPPLQLARGGTAAANGSTKSAKATASTTKSSTSANGRRSKKAQSAGGNVSRRPTTPNKRYTPKAPPKKKVPPPP